jgi:hypothetical protein
MDTRKDSKTESEQSEKLQKLLELNSKLEELVIQNEAWLIM